MPRPADAAEKPEQQCCAPAAPELSAAMHDFLKALASPTRQRIMLLFSQGAELAVGEVAERAGVGQPTASEQLAQLRQGGILASRKEGKTVLYRADKERTSAALANLQEYLKFCC